MDAQAQEQAEKRRFQRIPPQEPSTNFRQSSKHKSQQCWRTGVSAYGFAGEVWNSRRLAVALKKEFGVSYHPDHCGYLVRKMG